MEKCKEDCCPNYVYEHNCCPNFVFEHKKKRCLKDNDILPFTVADRMKLVDLFNTMDNIIEFCKEFMKPVVLKTKKLSEHAILPTQGSSDAAGHDLYSAYDYVVEPHGKVLIKTDIAVKIPPGHYGRIAPRSGMSWNNHTDVGAGVIDQDYRAGLGVVLFNHSDKELKISKGDRVAQLILEKNSNYKIEECDDLDKTDRGEGGFGSTGK